MVDFLSGLEDPRDLLAEAPRLDTMIATLTDKGFTPADDTFAPRSAFSDTEVPRAFLGDPWLLGQALAENGLELGATVDALSDYDGPWRDRAQSVFAMVEMGRAQDDGTVDQVTVTYVVPLDGTVDPAAQQVAVVTLSRRAADPEITAELADAYLRATNPDASVIANDRSLRAETYFANDGAVLTPPAGVAFEDIPREIGAFDRLLFEVAHWDDADRLLLGVQRSAQSQPATIAAARVMAEAMQNALEDHRANPPEPDLLGPLLSDDRAFPPALSGLRLGMTAGEASAALQERGYTFFDRYSGSRMSPNYVAGLGGYYAFHQQFMPIVAEIERELGRSPDKAVWALIARKYFDDRSYEEINVSFIGEPRQKMYEDAPVFDIGVTRKYAADSAPEIDGFVQDLQAQLSGRRCADIDAPTEDQVWSWTARGRCVTELGRYFGEFRISVQGGDRVDDVTLSIADMERFREDLSE